MLDRAAILNDLVDAVADIPEPQRERLARAIVLLLAEVGRLESQRA